jgi:two-component system, cell cycle response regulator DivK
MSQPSQDPGHEPFPSSDASDRTRTAVRGLMVLLADDDEDGLEIMGETLTRCGVRVLEARTGCDALSIALAAQPDVILLDLGLGDIHGLDVARLLKTDSTTRHIPVVCWTAHRHLRAEADTIGCSGYVLKPSSSEVVLHALVKAALAG